MIRRCIVVLLAAGALAIATVACSATQRQTFWCAYHASRLVHDIRHHHRGWAVFQGVLSAHHCSRALSDLVGEQ